MNKKIIIISVIIATIAISGCIKGPIDNVNDIIPKLSENIRNGNSNFNDAVNYTNNKNYVIADEKAQTALNYFTEAQNNLLDIKRHYEDINDTVYIQYMDLLREEISLKENATSQLQIAIQNFKNNNPSNGNRYVSSANNVMNQGIVIQNQREQLVLDNPDKFKTS
ncbi:MAG: hypothetical protein FWE58_01480 [Methanobrevibacter sp.]|nr:hypothetical protein [Methanobrevibacter sp.]